MTVQQLSGLYPSQTLKVYIMEYYSLVSGKLQLLFNIKLKIIADENFPSVLFSVIFFFTKR